MPIDEHGETVTLVECNDDGEPAPATDLDGRRTTDIRVVRDGQSAVRIIMDPFGEDHDVFVECHDDKWLICIHPIGGDPIVVVELRPNSVEVQDSCGKCLIKDQWEVT